MPLKNRLDEVIQRYETAASLVQEYKEGQITEDDLGRGFKRLRRERKAVDDHNRNYIQEQRRLHLGEGGSNRGVEDESVEAETLSIGDLESFYENEDDDDYDDDLGEEEDDSGEDQAQRGDGESSSQDQDDPREQRLWRNYGSFWRL